MVNPNVFFEELIRNKITFFTGVPDSVLKSLCSYVNDNIEEHNHIIAANEGTALGIASGYYLANDSPALVYMQNSGLGNIINPLLSLVDESVYKIPVLFLIGWRGYPDSNDAPQHVKQGAITCELLDTIGIKYQVINKDSSNEEVKIVLKKSITYLAEYKKPFAILIQEGTFITYCSKNQSNTDYVLTREKAIDLVINNIQEDYVIVSTTGKTSRELFELRKQKEQSTEKDFYNIGSMGHASSIALGIARKENSKNIYVMDGDGAFLMHMGAVGIIGQAQLKNFRHIVINNGAHDSVGGQRTVGYKINICQIANACGYNKTYSVSSQKELKNCLQEIDGYKGTVLIEVKVRGGSRKDLGRVTVSQEKIKNDFMQNFL